MTWTFAALMPHPPIIIPEVGKGREREASATLDGTARLCERLSALHAADGPPDAIFVLSPHQPYVPGAFFLNTAPRLRGSLAPFGAPSAAIEAQTSADGLRQIAGALDAAGIPVAQGALEDITKDHGALVPLRALTRTFADGKLPPLVVAGPSGISLAMALRLGKALAGLSGKTRWALVASGDLSHRLKPGAPAGFSPEGVVFDKAAVEALRTGNPGLLTGLSETVLENAGECGLRSLLILLGLSNGPVEVLSYEGPFGVGYCNALWMPPPSGARGTGRQPPGSAKTSAIGTGTAKAASTGPVPAEPASVSASAEPVSMGAPADTAPAAGTGSGGISSRVHVTVGSLRSQSPAAAGSSGANRIGPTEPPGPARASSPESIPPARTTLEGAAMPTQPASPGHPYARLARLTVERLLSGQPGPAPADIAAMDQDQTIWNEQKACFVSIKGKDGSLRGCIGTILPTQNSLREEIMTNAVSAAVRDPRFPPMQAGELDKVDISVDVLSIPEEVKEGMELDPKIFGVIVTQGTRRGLLLPDLPGVTSVEQQVAIAAQKAGIRNLDGARLQRFTVSRYYEE